MSAQPPLVSVVIPAYNAAAFLRETIDSVLAQSYAPVEIVVVDDGSTDGTPQVAASFGDAIHYVRQANRGVSSARNRGLQESTGVYLCFLDADDWLYPEDLERKVELLENNPELALAHALVEVTGPALDPTGEIMRGAEGHVLDDLLELIPPAIPCPSNVLIRRSVLADVGVFDEELGTSADYDLWLRIAREHPVGRVDHVSVKYRRHEGAMFTDVEAQLQDMGRIFRKHRARLGSRPAWRTLQWRFYRSVAGEYRRRGRWLAAMMFIVRGLWARVG